MYHQPKPPPPPPTTSAAASGSSEDFTHTRSDQPMTTGAGTTHRLNQIIQNFYTKAALIVLRSRVELAPAISRKTGEPRVNKWFNIELDETEEYAEHIKRWKSCDAEHERPPPLIIETYLTTDPLPQGQRLVVLDDDQKRWDVYDALEGQRLHGPSKRSGVARQVLLERWTIELGPRTAPLPADMTQILPSTYKKSVVLFRALYTYANFLPTYKLIRKLGRSRSTQGIKIGYRIVSGDQLDTVARADNLRTSVTGSRDEVTTDYSFGSTESPAGSFAVNVRYRTNTDFRVDDSEELISSRLMGRDGEVARPAVDQAPHPGAPIHPQVGSLPSDYRRNLLERPELGHAYGSLTTFHQAGIDPGTSPISALRHAREMGREGTPSPPAPPVWRQTQTDGYRSSLPASRPGGAGRRSSLSFQPFKTPTLSQSPLAGSPLGTSPRVSTLAVPTLGKLTEETSYSHPEIGPAATPSVSDSPKRQPVQRFTSSFGHRKNRPSNDRTNSKQDDDQTSSGKGSASSSNPPSSGLIARTTGSDGSVESVHTDAENIDDFLKMLDGKKDLLKVQSPSAADAAAKRTAAALNRFHKMRESNAALSESMTSSLLISKSPNTRYLTNPGPASVPSTSPSPGKPASPHTPHTPFAPSRLSAAFSHDDPEFQQDMAGTQDAVVSPEEQPTDEGSRYRDPNAIDIPLVPRRLVPGYKQSSSVQRQSSDLDEVADLYGVRSHSMGSKGRQDPDSLGPYSRPRMKDGENATDGQSTAQRPVESRIVDRVTMASQDGHVSDSGSLRSAQPLPYRSRYTRTEGPNTPSPGHGSSLSSTGAGSKSSSWTRTQTQNPSRFEVRSGTDDDDDTLDLPFAMDASTR